MSVSRLVRAATLVAAGVVAALVVAEIVLQGAAAYRAWSGRPAPHVGGAGPRILCVGDSNTYGLFLDEKESYPAQLQQLLGDAVHVVNMGYPGMNSSRLGATLPAMLDAIRPETVLIMIGANDFWTAPPTAAGGGESWSSWLSRHSRVYRLLFMLARGLQDDVAVPRVFTGDVDPTSGQVTAQLGDVAVPLGWRADLSQIAVWRRDLPGYFEQMIAAARTRGARPIVLTYPADVERYQAANEEIRKVAARFDVPVIDLAERFKARCTSPTCAEFLFQDGHPNAAGYRQVAEEIAAALPAPDR
jgi:lysophospholipase L1-like esterase